MSSPKSIFFGANLQPILGMGRVPVEEKIPSLFMVADYGDEALVLKEEAGQSLGEVTSRVDQLVSEKKIGGVLFKGAWTPTGLKQRIHHLQSIARGPLVFAQDLEWGLSMRHFGTVGLPKALCMGAITDTHLLEDWADMLAQTAKEVGITLFLGPVADVNSNPKNPIIHDRSFGDNPAKVAQKVSTVVHRLQGHGIAACAKHFPGHGNVSKDSHTDLPVVDTTMDQLRKVELVPFIEAIKADVACVMTAHLAIPKTPSGDTPASLSPWWCQEVLRTQLGFQGVVITDDLIMAGALGGSSPADAAVKAVRAGNDLCIVSKDIEECFDAVLKAVDSGALSEADINGRVNRIAQIQTKSHPIQESSTLSSELCLHDILYQRALTSIGEPFRFASEDTVVLQVGNVPLCSVVRKLVQTSPKTPVEAMQRLPRQEEIDGVMASLVNKKELLVVLCDLERSPACSFGVTPELVAGLKKIQKTEKTIRYVIFGSPYVLPLLPKPVHSALVAYERTPGSEAAVLQALRGSLKPEGVLPVRI